VVDRAAGRSIADERAVAGEKTPPRRGRPPRDSQSPSASRARVLDAARRLFAEYGFEATSIRQIASAVNIVSASLYHHFATKEEMLHEILRDPVLQHAERAPTIAQLPIDAERRLIALIILRIQTWLVDWDAHAISANEGQFFRQREDFSYVQQAKAQGYHAMESVLQDGMKVGLVRPELDIHYAITMIWNVLTSAATSARGGEAYKVQPPPRSIDDVFLFHIDAILRVVRTVDRIGDPIPQEEWQAFRVTLVT
jgi:AcrR family transcriptional regulator